jgi:hypothetical protein
MPVSKNNFDNAITFQIGYYVGSIYPTAVAINTIQERSVGSEDINGVVSGDKLAVSISIQIGDDRRRKPTGLTGLNSSQIAVLAPHHCSDRPHRRDCVHRPWHFHR